MLHPVERTSAFTGAHGPQCSAVANHRRHGCSLRLSTAACCRQGMFARASAGARRPRHCCAASPASQRPPLRPRDPTQCMLIGPLCVCVPVPVACMGTRTDLAAVWQAGCRRGRPGRAKAWRCRRAPCASALQSVRQSWQGTQPPAPQSDREPARPHAPPRVPTQRSLPPTTTPMSGSGRLLHAAGTRHEPMAGHGRPTAPRDRPGYTGRPTQS